MTIYNVRFLDVFGKEVAEFGFYEDEGDAQRRRAEVASHIKQEGLLEIRKIVPQPPSEFTERRKRERKDHYDLK
jgi:hypothetical protein